MCQIVEVIEFLQFLRNLIIYRMNWLLEFLHFFFVVLGIVWFDLVMVLESRCNEITRLRLFDLKIFGW